MGDNRYFGCSVRRVHRAIPTGANLGCVVNHRPDVGRDRRFGPGRLLIAVYGIFALSASARSIFQITTGFSDAALAYSLSLVAALIYIVATFALTRTGQIWYRVAFGAVFLELLGVVIVGVVSIAEPAMFARDSVWSRFGSGYGYIPLVLPIIGLVWLIRTRPQRNVSHNE